MDYDSKLSFLERLLGKYKYSNSTKEAEFFCCFCSHHKQKLSINIETDHWQCWVCGKAGKSLIYLIKKVGSREDIEDYLKKYKSNNINIFIDKEAISQFHLNLPEEFRPIVECKDSIAGRKAYDYLTRVRKIEEKDILRHKIGLAIAGDYQNRIIFPSFNKEGFINYFTTRGYEGGYVSPTVPKGYRSQIIPNELNIDWTKPVVLVEGYVDMLKSIPNTIPLFGKSIMEHWVLFEKIVMSDIPIFLALDQDAKKSSHKISELFMSSDVLVYNIDISPYKDVGEMSKEEFKNRYECAIPVSRNSIFREKLRMLC